ncbi:MAG TPA: DUF2384 domain-containing protein [Flavobacterium alvei]|nr:DUF2384 domain-containing protein [Flavobacterium alvei]
MQKRTKTHQETIENWDDSFWLVYHFLDENYEDTIKWFDTPNPKLNGKKPGDLLLTMHGRFKLLKFLEDIKELIVH